ncbi:MAG: putative nucleotidyltransferase [Kiritimatiellia bacterium]|jgi:predicted nucleotidyltransferase
MTPTFDLRAHTQLLTVAGSRAYGTHTGHSDVDLKGIAVPPTRWFYSYHLNFAQADRPQDIAVFEPLLNVEERAATERTKLEGVVYGMRKFCRLAADANPNILDVLFCREDEVRLCTDTGRALRNARHLFVTAKARFTFAGYASSQLKRIRTHRRWILHPPAHKPQREQFDLPPNPVVPHNQRDAAEAAIRKRIDGWNVDYGSLEPAERIRIEAHISHWLAEVQLGLSRDEAQWSAAASHVGLDDNLIEILRDERRYNSAMGEWQRFCNWKRSRNPERAALEAQHHYDTKHGAHLVRLMRMAHEILTTGEVHVWRGAGGPDDAQELLDIRAGRWSYEHLMEWCTRQDLQLEQTYLTREYSIPVAPDRPAIDALCTELVERALRDTRTSRA